MGDWGIKVSQKGHDVLTCADRYLVFNSSWPVLKILAQGSFSVPNDAADQVLYTHNLGYVPAFWIFDTSAYAGGTAGKSKLSTSGTSQYFGMNSTELKWLGATRGASGATGSLTGRYYIFTHNVQTNFTAPVLETTAESAGAAGDFGFKISKEGKDISSTDLRDFVIHSGTRTPQISKCGYGTDTAPFTLNVTHNLGYKPLYFWWAYIKDYGDSYWQATFGADDSAATSTNTVLTLRTVYDLDYAYMILKDPLGAS